MKILSANPRTYFSIFISCLLFPASFAMAQTSSLLIHNYPQSYVVQDGDTITSVARQFLKDPNDWSEVWMPSPYRDNDDEIQTGDTIRVDFLEGRPKLISQRGGVVVQRLSPQMREIGILGRIPAIPIETIQGSFTKNRIVLEEIFEAAPYIVSPLGTSLIIGTNDEVYARGEWPAGDDNIFEIYRQIGTFNDPDNSEPLGLELETVGYATLVGEESGDIRRLLITGSQREIKIGDHLLLREDSRLDSTIYPSEPGNHVDGQILAMTNSERMASQLDTVLVDVGAREGLIVGNILSLHQPGQMIVDTSKEQKTGFWSKLTGSNKDSMLEMPSKEIGTVLVYRVFEKMSYAVILSSTEPTRVGDIVVSN